MSNVLFLSPVHMFHKNYSAENSLKAQKDGQKDSLVNVSCHLLFSYASFELAHSCHYRFSCHRNL